ncbi:hypothetical protein ACO0K7_07805 [Undibacterium sp. Ji67W]|uniref:hypothetical protein n=1 Tax=Undibacterium sp. Ji67W TaxID=3413042 RepID=UPI003BF126F0
MISEITNASQKQTADIDQIDETTQQNAALAEEVAAIKPASTPNQRKLKMVPAVPPKKREKIANSHKDWVEF